MSTSVSTISDLCTMCCQVFSRPCQIYVRETCNHCFQRIVACRPCGGRGWTSAPQTSHQRHDCRVCNKTGHLLACDECEGRGITHGINWEQLECGSCFGNGGSICTNCGGHIWIRRFVCLCTGDVLANSRRSHVAPTFMAREHWSEYVRN